MLQVLINISWITLSKPQKSLTLRGRIILRNAEDEMKDMGMVTVVHEYSIRKRLRNAAATIHFE